MDDRDYIVLLYDYYSDLFSEKQKNYFEQYYFDNLSYAEISANLGVSRNAIHKCIHSMEEKLYFYEEKLRLVYKTNIIRDIINLEGNDKIKTMLRELI